LPSTGGSDSGAERSASASTRYVTPTLPRHNYEPGDESYLLGFSPFTARSTAGFIRNAESLRGEHAAQADQAYQLYRRRERHPRTDRPTGSAMRI